MTDALAENITSRTRTGKRVISLPRISGVYASRIIRAETWYPSRYDYKDGLRSGTRSLITGFGMNLVREFIINFLVNRQEVRGQMSDQMRLRESSDPDLPPLFSDF